VLALLVALAAPAAATRRAPARERAAQPSAPGDASQKAVEQRLQSAARRAAEDCLAAGRCHDDPLLEVPVGTLDVARSRSLRQLAALVQAALEGHARELSRIAPAAHRDDAPSAHDEPTRLDRFGTGELRLGPVAGFSEITVHLRGRIVAPDGTRRAAVVHFSEQRSGRPPRVSRLVLPITGVELVGRVGGELPAPVLGWRGAVLDELDSNRWARVLSPQAPSPERRASAADGFCDAACSEWSLDARRRPRVRPPLC
jgi:hypothetical protein